MFEIIGVDGGNDRVKIFGERGPIKFISSIGEYRDRKLEQTFGDEDMEFEYNGRKGFAGTLARYESEFCGNIMGDTKAHEDLLIRVLLGIHRYSENNKFKIVVGQTIGRHTETEKDKIKGMLNGKHTITVNDITKTIEILDTQVAAEGGAAFWSSPQIGVVRILDFGSGTVNAATLNNAKYIDKDSFTLTVGMNTTVSKDMDALARYVATECLKKWSADDNIFLVGGAANTMLIPLSNYFFNTKILYPGSLIDPSVKRYHPIYANAIGFYNIGRRIYGGKDESKRCGV